MKKERKTTRKDEPTWEGDAEQQLRSAYKKLGNKYEALKKIMESAPEPNFNTHLSYNQEVWMGRYSKWYEDLKGVIRSLEG